MSSNENQLLYQARPDAYNVPLLISQFIDIDKLRGPENYEEWHEDIRSAFEQSGVWDIVTGSEQPLLVLDPSVGDSYKNWQRLDKSLSALLGITVDRAILVQMPENVGIDVVYEFLQTNYQPQPRPEYPELFKNTLSSSTRELHVCQ